MPNDSAQENRARVERYFDKIQTGASDIADLFADDACWIAPQSSPVGRRHDGKAAVLALMSSGVGLYDPSVPMQIDIETMAAEGEHVFVEMNLRGRTLGGAPYLNHYVFVFRFVDGLITEIREHLDTHYAQRMLFDPTGQASPLDGESR